MARPEQASRIKERYDYLRGQDKSRLLELHKRHRQVMDYRGLMKADIIADLMEYEFGRNYGDFL